MKDTSVTPHILRAAAVGNLLILRELVNHGADLGMYLTPNGQNECVEYLLSFKSVADDIDRDGFYCCMCPLKRHMASEYLMTSDLSSSLSLAIAHLHTETAQTLIKNGAKWNANVHRKLPPLYHMVTSGATALIRYISKLRREKQQYWPLSCQRWTLLQWASYFKGEREEIKQLVSALINAGENLDTPNRDRRNSEAARSSLHFAIRTGNIRLATVLLEAGSYAGIDCDRKAVYEHWQHDGILSIPVHVMAPMPPPGCEMWPLALFNFMCDTKADGGRRRPVGVSVEDYSRWRKGYRDTKEYRLKMERFWGISTEEMDYFRALIEARVRP
ncbi:hypothetical protein CCHR01_12428 [Colletotrichum chrysophilum]|uniref:Ankyrin repeat protein n=1 Tax=Colletotrichum chrysophilum TaxID=1836956 RepID=A0AAD9AC65_9PEZI|nr:hypothetical protein CCHR01_12428 [Colletotrichum chrysophilum]